MLKKKDKCILAFLMLLLVLIPSIVILTCCKSPAGPDPIFRYRYEVKVTYTRYKAEIVFRDGGDSTSMQYRLYDPKAAKGYISNASNMEKTHEDSSKEIFEGYIKEGVFIQQGIYQRKHQLFVRDCKFYNGQSDISVRRGQNITIEGAYEMESSEHVCYFKMAAEDNDE